MFVHGQNLAYLSSKNKVIKLKPFSRFNNTPFYFTGV